MCPVGLTPVEYEYGDVRVDALISFYHGPESITNEDGEVIEANLATAKLPQGPKEKFKHYTGVNAESLQDEVVGEV